MRSAFTRALCGSALLILLAPPAVLLFSILEAVLREGGGGLRPAIPSQRTMVLLLRSAALAAAVAVSCVVVGTLAATVLGRRTRLNSWVRILFPALLVVPPYLQGLMWTACIVALNSWLGSHGVRSMQLGGWLGAWLAQSMALLPLATGFALVSLKSIDPMLIEAASTSRGPSSVLSGVVIPLAAPYLVGGGGILFLLSFLDYSVPSLFTVNVYALEIFSRYSADGQAVVATLVSIPVLLVAWLVIGGVLSPLRHAASTPLGREAAALLHGPWPWWLSVARGGSLVLLVGQVLIPLGGLIWMCGSARSLVGAAVNSRHEIAVTCEIAAACACIALLLGPVIARQLVSRSRWGTFWWFAVCIAFAMPGALAGVGVARLSTWCPVLREGQLMPVWANVSRVLPIAAFIMYAHLRRLDPLLLDACRLYRRNWPQGLLQVHLPLALPALLLTSGVCVVLPMGELAATIIVAAPGDNTLMMRLYNLLHYGESKEVAALCVVLMIMAFGCAGGAMAGVRVTARKTVVGVGRGDLS